MTETQSKLQLLLNLRDVDVDFAGTHKHNWHGKTGHRSELGHCTNCTGSSFSYDNGVHWSDDGIRGYKCARCGTIKPALPADFDPFQKVCKC